MVVLLITQTWQPDNRVITDRINIFRKEGPNLFPTFLGKVKHVFLMGRVGAGGLLFNHKICSMIRKWCLGDVIEMATNRPWASPWDFGSEVGFGNGPRPDPETLLNWTLLQRKLT